MTLTDKEVKAVLWLIEGTKDRVNEIVWWSEDATKSGECEKGHDVMIKQIVGTLTELKEKLKSS